MSDRIASYPSVGAYSIGYEFIKRFTDIVLGSLLLLLFSPLLLTIGLLIRLTSHGPALFRQARVGRANRIFYIYKFRTMHENADQNGPQITSSDDSRVTTIGRILRDTKLDELPQLINVVKGEMSLVGPRPQVPRFVNQFPNEYRDLILTVRPGITGPTQLRFCNEESLLRGRSDRESYYVRELLPIKCEMDAHYVIRRSIGTDIQVLWHTFYLFMRGMIRKILRLKPKPAGESYVRERLFEEREEKADVVA
jgi:lipopolysaccharide/colanic/teichoic acid biosynthesis glycosyltransferase